ncbi:MAG: hypothetical protein QOC93_4162 [Actinomycetota bacterium]|nr:Sulfotransferase family protein [Cryptosporangiaceae bacterium]MDQ1679018.1 hypothetical protein [Actinomycetota bacterium]
MVSSAEGAGPSGAARPHPVRVLYIGGMARSGSTLLDLMLGQLPAHCDVGELFYLWRDGVERDLLCACGERFGACPFWTEVGRVAFGGWDRVDTGRVLALQADVDRTSRLPAILGARRLPGFRSRLDEYTEVLTALYAAIATVSGAEVVVDSTKRPSLAYILRRAPGIDLRLVHVVRDPRGVVYSWTKQVKMPAGAAPKPYMNQRSPRQISRRWVTVTLMTATLRRLGVPTVLVRYEDLVREPAAALRRVAAVSTGGPEPDLSGILTPDGLRLGESHTVAGGRVRMRTGLMPLRLDEEWRTALPSSLRRFVSAVTWPLRRRFGYR